MTCAFSEVKRYAFFDFTLTKSFQRMVISSLSRWHIDLPQRKLSDRRTACILLLEVSFSYVLVVWVGGIFIVQAVSDQNKQHDTTRHGWVRLIVAWHLPACTRYFSIKGRRTKVLESSLSLSLSLSFVSVTLQYYHLSSLYISEKETKPTQKIIS